MSESRQTDYRYNAADIHSHVIVDVDDGADSMDEAMEMLRLDREEGVRTVFATPHYGSENIYTPDPDSVLAGYNQLKEEAILRGIDMEICLGNECYCSEEIVERIRRKEVRPLLPSDWYMVEFLEYGGAFETAEVILRRLKHMRDNGIRTILAHPERYTAIQEDWDLAKRICDMGVLLQVNAYDLYLNKTDETRGLAQWMAKEGMISFLGSDMHGLPPKRAPKMKEGIRWLYENVETEYANDVVRRNAERYLGIKKLPAACDLK